MPRLVPAGHVPMVVHHWNGRSKRRPKNGLEKVSIFGFKISYQGLLLLCVSHFDDFMLLILFIFKTRVVAVENHRVGSRG